MTVVRSSSPLNESPAHENGTEARGPGAARVLIVKLGAIGDVVMAIPAAAQMHAAGYAVDWVVSEGIAPVLRLYPWIRVIPADEEALLRGSVGARLGNVVRLWQELRRGNVGRGAYDLCATLYYDRRYRLLTWPVRARRRISLSWTDRDARLLPGRHHTDEYARILLGRADDETPSQLAPVPAPNLPVCTLPTLGGRGRVVLVPAGARNMLRDDALRRWPVENYVTVARDLVALGYQVVLTGGPGDGWASAYFSGLAETVPEGSLIDRIGQLSLVETLSLLDSATVTATHDTGPLHLAGITSTAIVTIFGPTDPHGRLPQRENCVALWGGEGFACRPCYDGRDYAACHHNGCVEQVTPAMVLEQIERLVAARAEGQAIRPEVLAPTHTGLVRLSAAGERVTK